MEKIIITETRIGATTYTVERVFSADAKENALEAIERLLLQKARSEGQGHGMAVSRVDRSLNRPVGRKAAFYGKY